MSCRLQNLTVWARATWGRATGATALHDATGSTRIRVEHVEAPAATENDLQGDHQ